MGGSVMIAKIPVALDFPIEMSGSIREVLNGEYEAGFFGEDITVIDIGANVGSFAVWAALRWPRSRIHAYEPNPGTFKMLAANVEPFDNISCHNLAVYPSEKRSERFWSRYAGDGEAGLVAYMSKTFERLDREDTMEVPVIHPRELPKGDVIKLDVEGAEALILRDMNLQGVSLVLLEYQNVENRDAIKDLLSADFSLEYEDGFEWDALLPNSSYREELKGDFYGRLFFANKHQNRLRRVGPQQIAPELSPGRSMGELSLRQLLSALPSVTKAALSRRVRNIF